MVTKIPARIIATTGVQAGSYTSADITVNESGQITSASNGAINTGPQGLAGAQGTTGPQGVQGVQGTTGTQGTSGYIGADGAQGVQGTAGTNGTIGVNGAQGTQGVQGTTGTTGATGSQGTTGATGAAGSGTITNDTTTNSTHYPVFAAATTGTLDARVSSSKATWNPSTGLLTLTGLTVTNTITGNISGTASYTTGTSGGAVQSWDNRTISPSSMTAGRMGFGFTAFNNNNTSPWADYFHLRSYTDATGGNDNLVVFNKNSIGMRIYQQGWGSATAYSSYKDVAWTDGTNASGSWGINVTGSAATFTSTSQNSQFNSIGVGTTASGTAGRINGGQIYASDWLRTTGDTGLYFESKGYGLWSAGSAGASYGNASTYGAGVNSWQGWNITNDFTWMGRDNTDCGLYDSSSGHWIIYSPYNTSYMGLNSSSTSASYSVYLSGSLYTTSTITEASDRRKKKDIVTIDGALAKVNQLRGVYYSKIDNPVKNLQDKREMGVIAQEVDLVTPEVVTYASDVDEYGVSYGNFAGLFIEAIKELTTKVNNLAEELKVLKDKYNDN